MTKYFIYTWGKIPIEGNGIIQGALRICQNRLYPEVSKNLYNAFGYKVKEIRRTHPDDTRNLVYIKGTIKECNEYIAKLESAGFGKLNNAIESVTSSNIFRLLPKAIRGKLTQIPSEGQAVSLMIDKLNAIGIYFTYGINSEEQFRDIAAKFENNNVPA
jgi:hypothetical protein